MPPQGQDNTPELPPSLWRFYQPKLSTITSGWWRATNFYNDLIGAIALTIAAVVCIIFWTIGSPDSPVFDSPLQGAILTRIGIGLTVAAIIYVLLRVNYQRFVALDAKWRAFASRLATRIGEARIEGRAEAQLQMADVIAGVNSQLTDARGVIRDLERERDELRAAFRAIDEARPLLRLEPRLNYVQRGAKPSVQGVEVLLHVINERPSVQMYGVYADRKSVV